MSRIVSLFWNRQEKRLPAGWRLLLQLVVVLVAQMIATIAVVPFAHGDDYTSFAKFQLAATGATLLATWLATRLLDKRRFADLGFHFSKRWLVDCGFGLALGAFLMGGIFVTEVTLGWAEIVSVNFDMGTLLNGLLPATVLFICVSMMEEVQVRGYQMTNLTEGLTGRLLSPTGALVASCLLTSLFFGLYHLGNPNSSWTSTINIALGGVFLASGKVLTGELAIPLGAHVTWNLFQSTVFGFPVSGMSMPSSLVTIKQLGNATYTGGDFGPEAGLIGVAAIVLGTVLTAAWVRVHHGQSQVNS